MSWYFKEVFATDTLQGSYSHTYPGQIRAFPIRHITFTTPADERERQVERLVNLYDSGDDAELLKRVQAVLGAKQTDVIHDLLAHLAQQMISLNQQKQGEVRHFLRWLEGEVKIAPTKDGKAGIDALSGKTTI